MKKSDFERRLAQIRRDFDSLINSVDPERDHLLWRPLINLQTATLSLLIEMSQAGTTNLEP